MNVVAGSAIVTPSSMCRSAIRRRINAATSASWTREFTPRTSVASSVRIVADLRRVRGSELFGLQSERRLSLRELFRLRFDLIRAAADDEDGLGEVERLDAREHVAEQGLSAHRVKNLRRS